MMSCPETIRGEPPAAGAVNQEQDASRRTSVWGRHLSLTSETAGEQLGRPIRAGPSTAGQGPGREEPSGTRDGLQRGQHGGMLTRDRNAGSQSSRRRVCLDSICLSNGSLLVGFTGLDDTLMALHPFYPSHTNPNLPDRYR